MDWITVYFFTLNGVKRCCGICIYSIDTAGFVGCSVYAGGIGRHFQIAASASRTAKKAVIQRIIQSTRILRTVQRVDLPHHWPPLPGNSPRLPYSSRSVPFHWKEIQSQWHSLWSAPAPLFSSCLFNQLSHFISGCLIIFRRFIGIPNQCDGIRAVSCIFGSRFIRLTAFCRSTVCSGRIAASYSRTAKHSESQDRRSCSLCFHLKELLFHNLRNSNTLRNFCYLLYRFLVKSTSIIL